MEGALGRPADRACFDELTQAAKSAGREPGGCGTGLSWGDFRCCSGGTAKNGKWPSVHPGRPAGQQPPRLPFVLLEVPRGRNLVRWLRFEICSAVIKINAEGPHI